MAYVDLNKIRASVETPLDDLLRSEYPNTPVAWNNVNYVPDSQIQWVRVEVTFGSSEYLSLGTADSGVDRLFGIAIVDVFTPAGDGAASAFDLATRVRDLYNRKIIDTLYFDAARGPQVVQPNIAGTNTSGFFQTEVRVTFEYIAAPTPQ